MKRARLTLHQTGQYDGIHVRYMLYQLVEWVQYRFKLFYQKKYFFDILDKIKDTTLSGFKYLVITRKVIKNPQTFCVSIIHNIYLALKIQVGDEQFFSYNSYNYS